MDAQLEKWENVLAISDQLRNYHPDDDNREFMELRARYALRSKAEDQDDEIKYVTEIEQSLSKLAEKYPDKVQIPLFMAQVQRNLGRVDRAREILYSALKCTDKLPAEMELVRLDQIEHKYDKAIEKSRKLCAEYPDKVEPRLLLAECRDIADHYSEARIILEMTMNEFPHADDQKIIGQRLAAMAMKHGEREYAIQRLEEVIAKSKEDMDVRRYLLCQPEIYNSSGKAQKLINEMRQVEGESGLRWRFSQAWLWMMEQDWRQYRDQILEDLNRCVEADPQWADPLILLGQFHERIGDMPSAETFYRRALANDPAAGEVWDRLADIYEKQNRMADLRSLLDQIPANAPDRYLKRACLAAKTGDAALAIDELKHQLEVDAKNLDACLMLAKLTCEKTKDVTAAFQILDMAEKMTTDQHAILSVRCDLLRSCEKYDDARQLLSRAVEKNKDYKTVLLRAKFLEDIGDLAEAEKDLQRLHQYDRDGQSYERLGQFYVDHQRLDDALRAFETGGERFPDNLRLKRRWMKGLFLTGRTADKKKAVSLLDEMEKKYPDDADILYVRGLVFLDSGKPDAEENARKIFERVINRNPTMIDAQLKLIALSLKNKNYAKARETAIMAQAANPGSSQLILARAQIERLSGNYENAYEMASAVVSDEPKNIDAIRIQAETAIESRDPEQLTKASALAENTLKSMPDNETIQIVYSQILRSQNRVKEAISYLESCHDPKNIQKMSLPVSLTLAELYRLDGRYAPAGELLHHADKISPMNSAVVRERIYLLTSQREYLSLVQYIGKYRKQKTVDPQMVILASSLLAETGEESCIRYAVEYLEEISILHPEIIDAKLQLAWMDFQRKNYDRSQQLYRDVLKSQPSNIQAINNLAWILAMERRDYSSAMTLINRAVDLMPENPDLRDTRADIFMAAGQMVSARNDYARCVQLSPPDSKIQAKYLLKLARVTAKLGDSQQTQDSILQAKSIDRRLKVFTENERQEMDEVMTLHAK
jgi:tetratricopeptide (TPR) repeat protein